MSEQEVSAGITILDALNGDCWRAVLKYLDFRDIVRSERVSRQWQLMIYQYLQGAHFSIEYPWYQHDSDRNLHVLVMDEDDPKNFDTITSKWGPFIMKADCINKASLKVIGRNCPNIEDITFYAQQENNLLNGPPINLTKLKRVHFRSCDSITDKCIGRWLAQATIEELAVSESEHMTGQCLTEPNNLKTLSLKECMSLDLEYLLSADLTGLTKLELIYAPKKLFEEVHLLIDKLPNLEDLCVRWEKKMSRDVGGAGAGRELAAATARRRLRRLDLSYNPDASDAWLEALAAGCDRLRELVVEGCLGVSARGVLAVCARAGPALRALHVGSNGKILDRHAEAFVSACPNLQSLDVSYCYAVSERLVAAVGEASRGRGRLRLQVEHTMIEGDHVDQYPWLTLDFGD